MFMSHAKDLSFVGRNNACIRRRVSSHDRAAAAGLSTSLVHGVLILGLMLGGGPYALAQSGSDSNRVTSSDVKRDLADAGRTLSQYAIEQKDAAVEQAKRLADDLNVRIEQLEAEAKQAGAATSSKMHATIDTLREKSKSVAARLSAMQQSSQGAWTDLRQGFVGAWHELKGAVLDAQDRLSGTNSMPDQPEKK